MTANQRVEETPRAFARPATVRPSAGLSTTEAIKDYILTRGLKPGDPLPTEAELCASLGVSRSSVREAIRTLVSLDIVDVRHGHGTTVGGLSLAPFINGLVFRSLLNPEGGFRTLLEVVELRQGLDMAVADALVQGFRDDPAPEIDPLVATMREQSERGESFMAADRAFHAALLERTGNDLIRQVVAALWEVHTIVVPQLGIPQPDDIRATVDSHGAMLEALRAGDADGYRAAVVAHYSPLHRVIHRAQLDAPVGD